MKYFAGLLVLFASSLAFAESAAAPKPSGWLDIADCSGISGWAWDGAQPSARMQLDLYDGSVQGSPFATVPAENYRADLKRAGIGDGVYGFYLATPASLKDGRLHTIIATIAGTNTPIQIGTNTLSCPAEARGYSYYYSDTLSALQPDSWAVRGDANVTPDGLTSGSASGAALISRLAVPDGSSDYEVRAQLSLNESGGVYTIYLHASPDAAAGPASVGSFYAIELENPTFTEKGCAATLSISKRSSETVTRLRSESVACSQGMVLRAVAGADGRIGVWLDHRNLMMVEDWEVASGQPGVGVRGAPAANSMNVVDIGQLDRVAPGPFVPADVQVAASASGVELSWPRITDDPDGVGVGVYTVARDGNVIAHVSRANPSFVDKAVTPGGVYTYEISALDMHLNQTSTSVTVATPESQAARQ